MIALNVNGTRHDLDVSPDMPLLWVLRENLGLNGTVVFIDETGPKERRVKRLAIMDRDGFNVRLLTDGRELVLTPRFSPTNQEITYMSYAREQPRVVLMNLDSGQRDVVGDFPVVMPLSKAHSTGSA